MTNSADPDQLASSDLDLHCLQRQDIYPGSEEQGLKWIFTATFSSSFEKPKHTVR